MFVKTIHLRRPLAVTLAALVAGFCGVGLAYLAPATVALPAAATAVTDNGARLAFLAEYGWQAEEEPVEILEIALPSVADETLARYNDLQKAQGFDLTRFLGRTVKRYSYRILNYPEPDREVRANLLISEGTVIAADLSCNALDGFMRGLNNSAENF